MAIVVYQVILARKVFKVPQVILVLAVTLELKAYKVFLVIVALVVIAVFQDIQV